jgi:hypothetical protein
MIPWIIQSGLISFILIFLIHYLFTFFKENLTVPKVIDLVNKPKEQYEELLRNNNKESPTVSAIKPDMSSMKDELKNYLKDLKAPSIGAPESVIPESATPESATPESANLMGGSQYSSY